MMLGIGFIPLLMAIEYIKNREKYSSDYIVTSILYLLCLPIAYYDALFYKDFGKLNWVFSEGIIPYIYRGVLFVSGTFLLIKGLQLFLVYIKKILYKEEEKNDENR